MIFCTLVPLKCVDVHQENSVSICFVDIFVYFCDKSRAVIVNTLRFIPMAHYLST